MTPLKPAAIRIGKNESGNRTGWSLVQYATPILNPSICDLWAVAYGLDVYIFSVCMYLLIII